MRTKSFIPSDKFANAVDFSATCCLELFLGLHQVQGFSRISTELIGYNRCNSFIRLATSA